MLEVPALRHYLLVMLSIGGGVVLVAAAVAFALADLAATKQSARRISAACRGAAVGGGLLGMLAIAGLGILATLPPALPSAQSGAVPAPEGTRPPAGAIGQNALVPPDERGHVRLQPVGGADWVSWNARGSGGDSGTLMLEAIGLDAVSQPAGRWLACVGAPASAVATWEPISPWRESTGERPSPSGMAYREPRHEVGHYRIYMYDLVIPREPGPKTIQLPPLRLRIPRAGRQRLCLSMVQQYCGSVLVEYGPTRPLDRRSKGSHK